MKFILTSLLCLGIALLGCVAIVYEEGWTATVLFGFSIALMFWLAVADLIERRTIYNYSKSTVVDKWAKYAQSLTLLDPSRYSALGLQFPELEIRWEGKPVIRLAGTDILLPCLQKFLLDSSNEDFAAERLYNDDKFLQQAFGLTRDTVRHQWWLAVNWLVEQGHITANTAVGNHSFKWVVGHRTVLLNQYVHSRPLDIPSVESLRYSDGEQVEELS